MAGPLVQKVVWITGGGSGLGSAMAIEFARVGARVAVSGRRPDRLQDVVDRIRANGGDAAAFPCDVTEDATLPAIVEAIVQWAGALDVAVANAGFAVGGRFTKLTPEDWRRQLDTNVVGAAATVLAALPELERGAGRIALIASVNSMVPVPQVGPYCASKAALRSMGQVLSMELHGSGVSCTVIHPGFVASEIAQVDNDGIFHPERKDRRPGMLMWNAEDAARVMVKAIAKRRREYVFTFHGRVAAFLGKHCPSILYFLQRGRNLRRRG